MDIRQFLQPATPPDQPATPTRPAAATGIPLGLTLLVRPLPSRASAITAARLVLAYTVGKPDKAVDPETLDAQEFQLWQQSGVANQELTGVLAQVQAPLALTVLRAALPALQEAAAQTLAQHLGQSAPEPAPADEACAAEGPGRAEPPPAERATAEPVRSEERAEAATPALLSVPVPESDSFAPEDPFLRQDLACWQAFLKEIMDPYGPLPDDDTNSSGYVPEGVQGGP